jgi:UDP-N-acetylglucosamine 2-epimerase (non-hydrolysing)
MEAGNRCFDFRVPEEINRKIVDHISDINLTYSDIAREYLLREGFPPDQIIKTGSPMKEVLDYYKNGIDGSEVLLNLGLTSKDYFVVSSHREENVDSEINLTNLITVLNLLAERFNKTIIFSTHPRTRKKLESLSLVTNSLIQFCRPFGFLDYVKLQCEAICTLSDSGTITEEGSLLNLPAITIRNAHERPEGMDVGTLIMSGLKKDRVLDAINVIVKQHKKDVRIVSSVPDYESSACVSKQILRVVMSYIDYINRTVWSK